MAVPCAITDINIQGKKKKKTGTRREGSCDGGLSDLFAAQEPEFVLQHIQKA